MAEFTQQIKDAIFASEGGYVDHLKDPGGATNMGITLKTLQNWRGHPVTKSDVRTLSREEAMQIYKKQYWDTVRGDDLPEGVDYAVMDYGVNSGPARAIKELQRVLGVAVDGVVGAQTLNAIDGMPNVKIIEDLSERRRNFVRGLSTYSTFGKGWESRISQVEAKASAMAMGAPIPRGNASSDGKAPPERPGPLDTIVKDAGGLSGIAGIVSTIFGVITDQPILQVAAVVFIGFLVWRLVIVRKQADPT